MSKEPELHTSLLTTDPIDWSCTRCGTQLQDGGEIEFRTGGSGGAATFLLGGWAELGEGKLAIRVAGCPRCGQLAMFDPHVYPRS
jgi:ribosomal protein S27AE